MTLLHKSKVLMLCGLLCFMPAYADILLIKDGQGQQYQIDGNVRVENGVRISRIRWPDNRVNTIKITTCGQNKGTLYTYDAAGKRYIGATSWDGRGSMLIDRVAVIVCKNSP
jgi:hypothetical protein